MLEKICLAILIALGVVTLGLLVVVIVMACNGATVDSNTAWLINPANPASPVHQALF